MTRVTDAQTGEDLTGRTWKIEILPQGQGIVRLHLEHAGKPYIADTEVAMEDAVLHEIVVGASEGVEELVWKRWLPYPSDEVQL